MATKKKEDIFEELMHFLGGPMFQVPVNSFMDEKSLSLFHIISNDDYIRCHKFTMH